MEEVKLLCKEIVKFYHISKKGTLVKKFYQILSDDYREILRNGLRDLKFDDAIYLFSEMVKSRPLPSIIEFSKLMSAIAKMNKYVGDFT